MADLKGKRVAFLATDMVEQVELTETWKAIEEAGPDIDLVSLADLQGADRRGRALVQAALDKAGTEDAVMIGDTGRDIEAAAKAGVDTFCVLTGGWSKQELRETGAVAIFESVDELPERLDEVGLSRN